MDAWVNIDADELADEMDEKIQNMVRLAVDSIVTDEITAGLTDLKTNLNTLIENQVESYLKRCVLIVPNKGGVTKTREDIYEELVRLEGDSHVEI